MEKNVDDKRGENQSNIVLQRMLICLVVKCEEMCEEWRDVWTRVESE